MDNSNSNNKNIPVYKMWWFWVVIIGTFLIWSQIISDNASNFNHGITATQIRECKQNAISIEYKDLMRYPDKYYDIYVVYTGKVLQVIQKSSDKYELRIATDSYYDDVVYADIILSKMGINILEGDMIRIYGKAKGNISYIALLGNKITIPHIEVITYELQTIN